jgi:TonB family protein
VIHHPPFNIGEPDWDRALWRMVGVSGGLHLVALVVLVLVPHSFLHHPAVLQSYTVDLVAPDQVGGTNSMEGGKGRVQAPPLAAAVPAPQVEPPKPPPAKVAPAKPPEPPPPAPKKEEVVQKPEPPKVEAKPKDDEMALAEKAKKAEPPPAPTAAKAAPSPQARPRPTPLAVAKAEPVNPQPRAPVDTKAAKAAEAARARDERIEAAVRRIQQQTGVRGGGTGQKPGEQPGGPISTGPGEGAGGAVRGVEYLIFYNQMINSIKEKWAWPQNANGSLEAVVRFKISERGDIFDVRITHSSGDAGFDASVERAVKAANPLSPPPVAYRKEFADVELTFSPEQLKM